jgi:hypothetical protein
VRLSFNVPLLSICGDWQLGTAANDMGERLALPLNFSAPVAIMELWAKVLLTIIY